MDRSGECGLTVLHPCDTQVNTAPGHCDIVFDLVAIHGLNGDSLSTWTHKSGHPMWLRHLLPEVLPNVRIMTYGYNASFRNFTAVQDIRSISSKLLTELVDVRAKKEESRRPIVFVCHSLGGIIAKKALLLGVSGQLAQVQEAVYGIVFLATPHNGSSIAACGSMIANMAQKISPLNPPRAMLEALKKDSKVLYEITDDFIPRASSLQIVSFYETRMTKIGLWNKMIVEESSAVLHLPHEVKIGQNSDHRDIARFLSVEDRNFRPIKRTLETFRQDIAQRELLDGLITPQTPGVRVYANPFESPFGSCDTFQGRRDALHQMELHFGPSSSSSNLSQRSFAICGLGGSGKTQTALKYAELHRHTYQSGVFFVTARSEATLEADIAHICEVLEVKDVPNKLRAFKQWLSQEEHSNWLLIFDNADDLESVKISRYVPNTSWGHLIVTSRDQAAITTTGGTGCVLERLEPDEAILVLLRKANILNPSVADLDDAQEIVQVLGCLPLAVDQGGAYIRSRGKTLTNFLRLCKERQKDILSFKPRLGDYDKTIFTTWDMNFVQIKNDSKDATNLLLLFCYLDAAKISEHMLDRACSPQKRWDRSGEMCEEAPVLAGIESELVHLVKDEIRFDDAVEKLLSFSLIHLDKDRNGLRNFSIHPLVQYCASHRISPETQDYWRTQAIALVCHGFPRNEYLEPLYRDLAITQLPHVLRVLKEYHHISYNRPPSAIIKYGLSAMLLAASRFNTKSWKQEAIEQAKILSQSAKDPYLHVCLAQRESSLLRIIGERRKSDEALEKFIGTTILHGQDEPLKDDARWNAQRGELVHSFAENQIQDGKLDSARHQLCQWGPINIASPSSMERIIMRSKTISLGRILKAKGCFQEALELLRATLEESETDNIETFGWRRVLLSNIADLYCELGQPLDAENLLVPELEKMKLAGSHDISSGRRLQLALAESFTRRGSYRQAEAVLYNVKQVLEGIADPDIIATRAIFRVWATLARVAHLQSRWDDSLHYWNQAGSALSTLGRAGSQAGIVHYSSAFALFKTDRIEEGLISLKTGQSLLLDEGQRMYWIVGLESYWRDYIIESVNQSVSTWLKI